MGIRGGWQDIWVWDLLWVGGRSCGRRLPQLASKPLGWAVLLGWGQERPKDVLVLGSSGPFLGAQEWREPCPCPEPGGWPLTDECHHTLTCCDCGCWSLCLRIHACLGVPSTVLCSYYISIEDRLVGGSRLVGGPARPNLNLGLALPAGRPQGGSLDLSGPHLLTCKMEWLGLPGEDWWGHMHGSSCGTGAP